MTEQFEVVWTKTVRGEIGEHVVEAIYLAEQSHTPLDPEVQEKEAHQAAAAALMHEAHGDQMLLVGFGYGSDFGEYYFIFKANE